MSVQTANTIISSLRARWRNLAFVAMALPAIATAILIVTILHVLYGLHLFWIIPAAIIFFFTGTLVFSYWKLDDAAVARSLNAQFPELQESTGLLLKPADKLGLLEKLQVNRVANALQNVQPASPVRKNLQTGLVVLAISVLLAIGIISIGPFTQNQHATASTGPADPGEKPEVIIPQVSGLKLNIRPPAYTDHAARSQQRFNVRAEEGSTLNWQISTTGNPSLVELIFNDSIEIKLEPLNKQQGIWSTSRQLKSNGFYQVRIGKNVSELYQLEIIPDRQPVITVQTPGPALLIEFGQSQVIPLEVNISDDYGLSQSSVVATIASGSGEAVKFKEQKLSFSNFRAGNKDQRVGQSFNLKSLGMMPGDELYFYVSATDNNKQETRSDIHTIRIEDTAVLMSMDGMMSGVDVKPEFFRSQRQIIIETEQLLKGKDTMTTEAFNNRCNDLGIDQKLLRLRYGKFLGEESESNIGEDGNTGHDAHAAGGEHHEEKEDHDEQIAIEDFNNAEKIVDRYSHKHDIAEDATFFDPETKKDLKATLAEMWQSELRLRTYKPTEALPYEYKALRLLKELQQKSREYVARTTTKTTPLKPEKRLTGELDKVVEPKLKGTFEAGPGKTAMLRNALSVVNNLDPQRPLNAEENGLLQKAAGELSLKAASTPAVYLSSFEAIKRINTNKYSSNDLVLVEKALQKMLDASAKTPSASKRSPDLDLSKEYFLNISKQGKRS